MDANVNRELLPVVVDLLVERAFKNDLALAHQEALLGR